MVEISDKDFIAFMQIAIRFRNANPVFRSDGRIQDPLGAHYLISEHFRRYDQMWRAPSTPNSTEEQ